MSPRRGDVVLVRPRMGEAYQAVARPSEVMIERVAVIPRAQAGDTIGSADAAVMRQVDRACSCCWTWREANAPLVPAAPRAVLSP